MFRRKLVFAGLGISLFTILIFVIWREPQKPEVSFDLADGTRVKLMTMAQGKILRVHTGMFWQRALFTLGGTNIPAALRGSEIVIPILNTNGGIIVELRHTRSAQQELDYFRINKMFRKPINGTSRLVQAMPDGKEMGGLLRVVNFDSSGWHFSSSSTVNVEDIYWEFPLSTAKEIHFRYYQTNALNNAVSTNEFTIPNPELK